MVGEGEARHQDGPVEEIIPGSSHSGTRCEKMEAVLHQGRTVEAGRGRG